jgi:hypothetical protein
MSERYYGSWTVAYDLWGREDRPRFKKARRRLYEHLQGWTKADAIGSALRYLAGWDVKIIDAWKEQPRQVQLDLFGSAA